MKHGALIDARDQEDLRRAEQMIKDGRALRNKVLTRLRARAFRKGLADARDG